MQKFKPYLLLILEVIFPMISLANPTFGPIPKSFPRDTLDFTLYLEHLAVGQILETLVSADKNGNVMPGLASSWKILNQGKTINFYLAKNIKFSNGKILTPEDIVYSINRHRINSNSQSSPLLINIIDIKPMTDHVVIHMKRPQVAIFKILSRDQLGILPMGWVFKNTKEPYIGTGPYRLVKTDDQYNYIKNDMYRNQSEIHIDKWSMIYRLVSPAAALILPDYVPVTATESIAKYRENKLLNDHNYAVRDYLSFVQNSAWWYPGGKNFSNKEHRRVKMGIVRLLFERKAKQLGYKPATGLIPFGVAGYIPTPIKFAKLNIADLHESAKNNPSLLNIIIAIPADLKNQMLSEDLIKDLEKTHKVNFKVIDLDPIERKIKPGYAPDIVISSWAGGFNDPEGFLPVITDVIPVSLEKYLGTDYKSLIDASTELDWTARAKKFRDFNEILVRKELLVPGWKIPLFSILSSKFTEEAAFFRYTPRLTDIKRKSE